MILENSKSRSSRKRAWPVQFGTITVADGIAMGTPGMRFSLPSRDIIADSIEAAIGGCDKNMPSFMIAISNIGIPAIFVYGGTIALENFDDKSIDLVSVFESVGKWNHRDMDKRVNLST